MAFDRSRTTDLRSKLEAVLADFGKANGVVLQVGTLTIRPDEIGGKLTIKALAPGLGPSASVDPLANDFLRHAASYGMQASDLGRTFTLNRKQVKLVGAKPNNRQYPLIVEGVQGGRYKVAPSDLLRSGGAVPAPQGRRSEADILEALRRVEDGLSPENLHGDGEFSASHVRASRSRLNAERARLVQELGREPSDQELYSY